MTPEEPTDWASEVRTWHHGAPAKTLDNAEKIMAVPELRGVYHAMNWIAAQEEGMCSVAHGFATALGCHPKSWEHVEKEYPNSAFVKMTSEMSEVGYYMGLQLLWSVFAFEDDGELGDPRPEYDEWPYDQTPEEWLAGWRAAIKNKEAQETP